MFCHNGYPEIREGADTSGSAPVFEGALPNGIDCQRCHGPGRAHVEAMQNGKAPEGTIINPARLSRELQLDLCMQCHLETTSFRLPSAIARYDRNAFSYRPGQPLGDFVLHFDRAPTQGRNDGFEMDKFEIAHAAYRLRQSACFLKSNPQMVCTTCHNPHDVPRGATAAQHYTEACLRCHSAALQTLTASGKHTKSQDCTGCHMPKRRTDDVVHVVMTDHYIQRRKPAGNLLDLRFESKSRGDVALGEWLATSQSDALVAVRNGEVVLEWMAPGIRDDEPHLMFSVTKSITALLCGALVGAGLIDTEAPVAQYVPEVAAGGFGDATVRHLLDMEASYAFVEDYSPGPDLVLYRNSAGWYPAPPDHMGLREFLATRRKEGEHGQRFRYLSPTTDMLGWVCEAASGEPYARAVSHYLWVPMGAEADADITLDRLGMPRAAGGLSAIARDLARLGMIVAEAAPGSCPRTSSTTSQIGRAHV